MYPIASQTVGSGGASSITFNSIPSTFTHLQLRMFVQTNRATYGIDQLRLTINGDTSSTYYAHELYGDGSSASSNTDSNNYILLGNGNSAGTGAGGTFSNVITDILDYTSTNKAKTFRSICGVDINGTIAGYGGRVGLSSASWQNSSTAISSIKIAPDSGTLLNQYTTFQLYGITTA